MKIVTSGNRYIDIDAYAGCIAYANMLKMKGIEAKAVSTAKMNESIVPSLLKLNPKLEKYEEDDNDEYIIIDVSNKKYFDNIVNQNRVIEIIDHHTGFEDYWKNKLGKKANIEFIGAVATLIVEAYEREKLIEKIPKDIAYLLMAAILDNTLNFKANVTNNRDIVAYNKLQKIVGAEKAYAEKYFSECQLCIEKNLKIAIENDTKIENVNSVLPKVFGQLTIWDKKSILDNKKLIYDTLYNIGTEWMMNLICLKEGKTYIIAPDIEVQKKLEKLLHGKFETDIMELDNVWLRKEIIKRAINNTKSRHKPKDKCKIFDK